MQGAALAIAKAGPPIKRKTADRIVAEFLHCVEQVNASQIYAYRIARQVVFGGYLTDRPDLGDIDLAVLTTNLRLRTSTPRRDAAGLAPLLHRDQPHLG